MSSSRPDETLLKVLNLPGQWQYWCEAEEVGLCWIVPADEAAQQAVQFTSRLPLDFMKVSRSSLISGGEEDQLPLF